MLKPNSRINFDDLKKLEGLELLKAILSFIIAFRERDDHNTGKLYAFGILLYSELLPKLGMSISTPIVFEVDIMFTALYENAKISKVITGKHMTGSLLRARINFLSDYFKYQGVKEVFNEVENTHLLAKKAFHEFEIQEKAEEVAMKLLHFVDVVDFNQRTEALEVVLKGIDTSSFVVLSAVTEMCIKDYEWITAFESAIRKLHKQSIQVGDFESGEFLRRLVYFIEKVLLVDHEALRVARKIRNDNKTTLFAEQKIIMKTVELRRRTSDYF